MKNDDIFVSFLIHDLISKALIVGFYEVYIWM